MSQAENAIKSKLLMIDIIKSNVQQINDSLLSNSTYWNRQKILEVKESEVLVNAIGVKKYNDLTVEELCQLLASLLPNQSEILTLKTISSIKTKLIDTLNYFLKNWELYEPFSKWFNLKQSVNAYVLNNKISAIFSNSVLITDAKNNIDIKKYNELDLLTLSVIYDIIANYAKKL